MLDWIFRPMRFGFALLALLGLSIAGCAGSQEESAPPPVAGSFVGEALPANAFIALVADLPEGEGNERQVRAYLCDGQTVSDWFVGTVEGNDLNLSSESGAQLEGQLTPDAVTGTIRDPNGDAISFEADPATGIAGLYTVDVSSDGALSGASELGARMEGQLGDLLEENGTYPVSGTITPPEGQPEEFKAITSPNTAEQHRWIVLEDGRIKGGNFGSHFEFDGFVIEQRLDCDFNTFDTFGFNHCDNFDFNRFVFVENFDDFDFDDFDDFDHDFDFDRDQAGGTFGRIDGGGQIGGQNGGGKGGGQNGGGKGGGQGGGQGGGGDKGGGGKN